MLSLFFNVSSNVEQFLRHLVFIATGLKKLMPYNS